MAARKRGSVRWITRTTFAFALVCALALASAALPNATLTILSTDPYTNTSSYHKTEVEPDVFAFGSIAVAAFQVGRFGNGGASNIGWARFDGSSWSWGFLSGTTVYAGGSYARISDPAVAYDAYHAVWMIASLALNQNVDGVAVLVSRSADGSTWSSPVTVAAATGGQDFDKDWIACDNVSATHLGQCYVQWDDFGTGNQLHMAKSADGGLTWAEATVPRAGVAGGQPVVRPNGTVVVPTDNAYESAIESFVSTDGGSVYSGPYPIANIRSHREAGNLRSGPLPSAAVDSAGSVDVVWADCRFRKSCGANDIVMSTSANGTAWTSPVRIPIDGVSSKVDHFLPGIDVASGTSGGSAQIGLTYYFYSNTTCSSSTCQLNVGFLSSSNGGANWTAATRLDGPFSLTWLPLTNQGYMVGDYISTAWVGGVARPVFAAATSGSCALGSVTSCREFMESPSYGIAAAASLTPVERAIPVSARSDFGIVRAKIR